VDQAVKQNHHPTEVYAIPQEAQIYLGHKDDIDKENHIRYGEAQESAGAPEKQPQTGAGIVFEEQHRAKQAAQPAQNIYDRPDHGSFLNLNAFANS
jgi:hypothetical protein